MNEIAGAIACCVAQVTAIGMLAGGLYVWARRAAPAAGSLVASTGLIVILALSTFAFSPWPRWPLMRPGARPAAALADRGTQAAAGPSDLPDGVSSVERAPPGQVAAFEEPPEQPRWQPSQEAPSRRPEVARHPPSDQRRQRPETAGPAVAGALRQMVIGGLSQVAAALQSARGHWGAVVAVAFLVGGGIGLLWLLGGLVCMQSCRRHSRLVSEAALLEFVRTVRAKLGCRRPIEVRESDSLAAAVTFGWRRPTILLPTEWTVWSQQERRVVLAHEIAHVSHHDFLTCLCGQLSLALHFYHPLVHWLVRSLHLEQELAADAAAAGFAGGPRLYLKTLAEMALRQDERPARWAVRAFLPTGRTFLRRIEMLRHSKPISVSSSLGTRVLTVAALALGGLLVAGFRTGQTQETATARTAAPTQTDQDTSPQGAAGSPSQELTSAAAAGGPAGNPVEGNGQVIARDDFQGKLGLKWEILHADPSHYSLGKRPGALTITTQAGSFSWSHQDDYKNLFLIDCPQAEGKDLRLTTCIASFTPQGHWNQAGLIFWKDEDNYIKYTYQTWYGRRVVAVVTETSGELRNAIHCLTDMQFDRIWLRVTKHGNVYEAETSLDGKSFERRGATRWGNGSIRKVGLLALNGSHHESPESDAQFEFCEVAAVPRVDPETIALGGTVFPHRPNWAAMAPPSPPPAPTGETKKPAIPEANLQIPAEMKACAENLRKIDAAVKKYLKDKGTEPDWLSDLVPDYLGAETLFCPDDPDHCSSYWPDPELPCSYCYELNPRELRSRPPLDKTMRDYKIAQRRLLGDVVPIVRCFHHGRVLNLAWDGRLYTSGEWFEALFTPSYRQSMVPAERKAQPETAGEKGRVLVRDDFNGKLGLKWDIVHPNASNYSLTKRPGALTITTVNGHFSKSYTNHENLFLIDLPAAKGEDFQVTTCVSSFQPVANWNQAGIVCFDDVDNYAKLVYEFTSLLGRPSFTSGLEIAGQDSYDFYPAPSGVEKVWLRIRKRGSVYQCATSTDGKPFVVRSSLPWRTESPKRIGLYANNGSTQDAQTPSLDASFEFFEVAALPPESPPADAASRYKDALEAFIRQVDNAYPFFELKGIRDDWEAYKKQALQDVEQCTSNDDFYGLLAKAVRCLRDPHMRLYDLKGSLPKAEVKYYPGISFLPAVDDQVVVMSSVPEHADLLKPGTVVTEIDGKNARQFLEQAAGAKWNEGGYFSSPQRARLYAYRIPLQGKKDEKHQITILQDEKPETVEVTCQQEARGWPHTYAMPEGLQRHGSCLYGKLADKYGYIWLRRIDGSVAESIDQALRSFEGIRGLIIDLRGNGGGGYSGEVFLRFIKQKGPAAGIPFYRGAMVVLIDAGAFSAGETFARDLAYAAEAHLMGSKTAGSSTAKYSWTLPHDLGTVVFSRRSRWEFEGQPIECNGIAPHEEVEVVPAELQKGVNSGIQRAQEYLDKKWKEGETEEGEPILILPETAKTTPE